ncbi:ATP-binding cassette domain-containing protein [bacterium]|nr:ATP-binding cassette domain-containing protein [bacterium]
MPSNLYEKSFFELSNGQQRKVALALIFSINKKCYILDEPTIGLDYETKIILCNLLKQLRNEGKIIIIISHDFD